jgi:hypothetical protein
MNCLICYCIYRSKYDVDNKRKGGASIVDENERGRRYVQFRARKQRRCVHYRWKRKEVRCVQLCAEKNRGCILDSVMKKGGAVVKIEEHKEVCCTCKHRCARHDLNIFVYFDRIMKKIYKHQ